MGWCMWIFCCINKYFQERTLLKSYELELVKQNELLTLVKTKKRGEFFTKLLWTKMLVVGNGATWDTNL